MKKLIFPVIVLLIAIIMLSGLVFISCGEEKTTTPATTTPAATTPAPTTPSPTTVQPKKGGTLTILYPYNLAKIPGWRG